MTFTVPTIFSAVDKVSKVVTGIKHSIHSFADSAQTGVARGERWFRKLTPAISETTSQMFAFARAAAIAGAVIGGVRFSVNALKDYETAIQSFRTIVSDLDDTAFRAYEVAINDVAKATMKSSIQVAENFEKIAGLNAEFAKTPAAISAISAASITLSKASRDELGKSAENLVGIMNQFNLEATQADRVINVLAAGQAVGASSITQTADAFTVFGAVAKESNLTLEQSVALTEVLASKSIYASEAGTALRGTMIRLKASGLGYTSGVFNMRDALVELRDKYDKLKTAKQKDALLDKVLGTINMTTGTILMNNVDMYDQFTEAVTGTSEAQKAAAINTNTLTIKLEQLSNKWVNMMTSTDQTNKSLTIAKNTIGLLTDNLETVVAIGAGVLAFFITWKVLLIVTKVALVAYNIALGITGALSGTASIAIGRNAIALGAYKTMVWLATASQWALNVAMTANPIGIIIVAIGLAVAAVTVMIVKWNEWGAALSLVMGPLGLVVSLIQSFRRNWDMIKDSFENKGFIAGIKAIGVTILDALIMPFQQLLEIIGKVTGADWAKDAAKGLGILRERLNVNVTTDEAGRYLKPNKIVDKSYENLAPMVPGSSPMMIEKTVLNGESGGAKPLLFDQAMFQSFGDATKQQSEPVEKTQMINPKATEREMIREEIRSQTYNSKLTIQDETGRGKLESDDPNLSLVPARVSSTMQR